MKKSIQNILVAAVFAAFMSAGLTARAEVKIAVVDLRKVFDNYYKTKVADAALKDEAAELEKERKDMVDSYKKREDEWKKLIDKANDQAVSSEEREKSKKAAEEKLLDLKSNEQQIDEFDRVARAKHMEKQRQRRDAIVTEIRTVLDAKAKAGGFTMVMDSSGESANGTPQVLYTNGDNDLTDVLLKELNATAPPLPKTDDTKDSTK